MGESKRRGRGRAAWRGAARSPAFEVERGRASGGSRAAGKGSDLRWGVVRSGPYAVRSASVGERRAARIAGTMPATAPIRIAAPMPPPHASAGITVVQCLVWA